MGVHGLDYVLKPSLFFRQFVKVRVGLSIGRVDGFQSLQGVYCLLHAFFYVAPDIFIRV